MLVYWFIALIKESQDQVIEIKCCIHVVDIHEKGLGQNYDVI